MTRDLTRDCSTAPTRFGRAGRLRLGSTVARPADRADGLDRSGVAGRE